MKIKITSVLKSKSTKVCDDEANLKTYDDISLYLRDKFGNDFYRYHIYEHTITINDKTYSYEKDKNLIEEALANGKQN